MPLPQQQVKTTAPLLVEVYLIISQKNNKPCIELRRSTTDYSLIKTILSCAFHEIPLIIMPTFSNKLKAVSNLVDKGILYKKNNNYYFTF